MVEEGASAHPSCSENDLGKTNTPSTSHTFWTATLEERVLTTVHDLRAATLHGLVRTLDIPGRCVEGALRTLEGNGLVMRCKTGARNVFVRRINAIRDCTCDWTCLKQITTLADPKARKLWDLLPLDASIRMETLQKKASDTLEWGPSTTRRRLRRLQAVGLVLYMGRHPRDRRVRLYQRAPMHPTAAKLFK